MAFEYIGRDDPKPAGWGFKTPLALRFKHWLMWTVLLRKAYLWHCEPGTDGVLHARPL